MKTLIQTTHKISSKCNNMLGGFQVRFQYVINLLNINHFSHTNPLFLGSHCYLAQKILLHKRPNSIMYDDNLRSAHCWPLLLTQSQDSITYRPVTRRASWHRTNLSVLKPLDDVRHQVHVFFGNSNHNALDPWHTARKRNINSEMPDL